MYKVKISKVISPFVVAIFLLLLLPLTLAAQQRQRFSIASFEADPFDLTAREGQYAQKDDNGAHYAIIKVTSNAHDDDLNAFQFNFGNLYHKTVLHGDELWVYVQQNAKWVNIEREGYTPVRRYVLGTGIEAGKVYAMHLSVTATPVVKQMVQFHVQPAGVTAMIMVKGAQEGAVEEPFGTTDANGAAAKSLRLGTYNYRIVATDYYEANGQFVLKDRTKMHTENVTLRPKFANVTLQVNADADIYVDGELGGKRTWTGHLNFGTYTVECRQENHRPTSQFITVRENGESTFQLLPPIPITGTLSVLSHPLGAAITIDGRDYGKTPRIIDSLLIGQHTIRLQHEGYRLEEQTAEVKEGQTTEMEVTLLDQAHFTINAQPQARLTLNGKDVGQTPYSFDGSSGEYDIRLDCRRYKTFHQKATLQASAPEQTFRLQRIFQMPTSFYLGAGFHAGMLMGGNAHVGAYISNINVEAYGTMGLAQETVFINYTDGKASQTNDLKATLLGGRVGYGITINPRLRITPQVGAASLTVKGGDITATALCATLGCRIDYALTSFLGVNLTPEGQFVLSRKDVFKQLSDLSSKVKGWGTGVGARIGIYLYF